MVPPPDGLHKDEWDPPSWPTQESFDATIVTTATSSSQVIIVSMAFSTQSPGDNDDSQTRRRPTSRPDGYPSTLPWPPYPVGAPTPVTNSWETSVSTTAGLGETPYPEARTTLPLSVTELFPGTPTGASSPSGVGPFGGRPSGWDWSKKDSSKTPIYAAAAAVPIIILAIIGAITLVCLRRRKKRRAEAAAKSSAQEMKMAPPHEPIVRPHMAPSPSGISPESVSQPYSAPPVHLPPTSVSSQVQPIILGPIGSSSNGAYLTGMDTSDMVSITSNNQLGTDPFSDNHSIMGPPPPYRPSSVPPPSFMTTSRQSSLRVPVSPLCSRGMERSPFDDPDDTMSVVSDMSFQHDLHARTYSTRQW